MTIWSVDEGCIRRGRRFTPGLLPTQIRTRRVHGTNRNVLGEPFDLLPRAGSQAAPGGVQRARPPRRGGARRASPSHGRARRRWRRTSSRRPRAGLQLRIRDRRAQARRSFRRGRLRQRERPRAILTVRVSLGTGRQGSPPSASATVSHVRVRPRPARCSNHAMGARLVSPRQSTVEYPGRVCRCPLAEAARRSRRPPNGSKVPRPPMTPACRPTPSHPGRTAQAAKGHRPTGLRRAGEGVTSWPRCLSWSGL